MSIQLHLPDLPEVPVAIGTDPGPVCAQRLAWRARLRSLMGTALPLMIMALLAVGTWWLVKNSPQPAGERAAQAARHVPDYTLARFTLQRYDPTGRLSVQIEGEQLRHYPDTDELEIDTIHVQSFQPDGRVTRATAREAVAAGDGSTVQLVGGAHVISVDAKGETVDFIGEHLRADFKARRISADRPVQVRQGQSEFSADAMRYDEATGMVTLVGPAKAVLMPNLMKQ